MLPELELTLHPCDVTEDSNDSWETSKLNLYASVGLELQMTVSAMIQIHGSRMVFNTNLSILCPICVGLGRGTLGVEHNLSNPAGPSTDQVMCYECDEVSDFWSGQNPFLWLRYDFEDGVASRDKTQVRLEEWLALYLPYEPLSLTLHTDDFREEIYRIAAEEERRTLARRPDLLANLTNGDEMRRILDRPSQDSASSFFEARGSLS